MARGKGSTSASSKKGANLACEDKLWAAADKLRGNMDATDYKQVVPGLIFLKYICDAFLERYNALKSDKHSDTEDNDEYLADNIFWIRAEARWDYLQKNAKRLEIETLVDDGMASIESDNRTLKGVLPKDYARPALDKARLGELIDLIAPIGLGDKESRQRDILGRVYEYYLGRFADAEGKNGGQLYTPACVVRSLVETIEPHKGVRLRPLLWLRRNVRAVPEVRPGARVGQREWQREIQGPRPARDFYLRPGIQLHDAAAGPHGIGHSQHRRQDRMGRPLSRQEAPGTQSRVPSRQSPVKLKDWSYGKVKDDVRWKRFDQPGGNAQFLLPSGGARKQKDGSVVQVDGGNPNYAWILSSLDHPAPQGTAGFVLANGSLTSNTSGEVGICMALFSAAMTGKIDVRQAAA